MHLVLSFVPPPQKAVHFVQEVQGPTLQSTAEMIKFTLFSSCFKCVGIIEGAGSFPLMLCYEIICEKKTFRVISWLKKHVLRLVWILLVPW